MFLNINKSFAAIITNTTDYSAGIGWQIKNYCWQHSAEDIVQPFFIPPNTPQTTLNSVSFYGYSYGQANNFRLIISTLNPNNNYQNYNQFLPYILADVNFTLPNSVSTTTIDLSQQNITITPNSYLYFWFVSLNDFNFCAKGGLYGRNNNDYNSPSAVLGGNYSNSNDIDGRSHNYFPMFYGGDRVKIDLDINLYANITINSPVNNNTYLNKDLIINFNYDILKDIQDLKVVLQFERQDETEFWQQIYYYGYTSAGSYATAVRPLKNLSEGGWLLKILFYNGNNFLQQSKIVNFNITGYEGQTTTSTPELTPEAAAGSAPTCGFLDCPADWLIYSIKYAFAFLFIPNSTQQQNLAEQFNAFKDTIQKKPPVGYFYAIKDALQQNITTSTATTTQIMDASTTQAFGAIFSPLKTGLGWILWLAAGAWVFIKIKNLNL